jgi:hypothetical protein
MGLKRGTIGNTLGKHIENLRNILKTHWEHRGKMLGTRENEKNPPPKPPKT